MIELLDVTKRFGETVAVSHLDLTVDSGELYGFIGPNGAGKTTTIKLITGLLRPTEGRVMVGGHDLESEPEQAKSLIGYIPDNPFLYPLLTGREFLQFVGRMYSLSGKEIEDRIESLLETFQIGDWVDLRTEEYSHGMRQKIVFSSAFIHNSKLIVIDEPMVGLDPRSAKLVKGVLREKVAEGATVFMSTHTLPIAEELCSKVGIINNGKLIAEGTIRELRRLSSSRSKTLEELYLELTE